MMEFAYSEKEKVQRIIHKALTEALSETTTRSYREIWVDMLGKIMELREAGSAAEWKKEKPDLQDRAAGKSAGYSFEEFIESIAKIENSLLKVLDQEKQEPILN